MKRSVLVLMVPLICAPPLAETAEEPAQPPTGPQAQGRAGPDQVAVPGGYPQQLQRIPSTAGNFPALPGQVPGAYPQQFQWVPAAAGNFPVAPSQAPLTARQQIQAAFPQSNYGATNYVVGGQPMSGYPQSLPSAGSANGVAPIPPLAPPGQFKRAEEVVSPFTNEEIVRLRQQLDGTRKAKAYRPVRAVPRISSTSVDLSPGAALPIVRILPGEMSTVVFLDSTGAPWPLAAVPRVSDPRYFDVEWLEGTPSIIISALSPYEEGNVTVFLHGLATPVVVKLASGEPDSKDEIRIVDYRRDLRVPGRGPNAQAPLLGPEKIALYDDTMQAFLDGIPPENAKEITAHGDVPVHTRVWQYGGAMFVRTSHDIQNAFDQSMASGDGTRVYRLPPTPYVRLSEMGHAVTLQLDIN